MPFVQWDLIRGGFGFVLFLVDDDEDHEDHEDHDHDD